MNRSSLGGDPRSSAASSSVVTKNGAPSDSLCNDARSLAEPPEVHAVGDNSARISGLDRGPSHKGPIESWAGSDALTKRPGPARITRPRVGRRDFGSTMSRTRTKGSLAKAQMGRTDWRAV